MGWSHPQYTKGQVDAAGQKLAKWFSGVPELSNWDYEEFDEMFAIVNNWRSAHNYPLIMMRKTLQNRAKSLDISAVVAQRIKRLSSIGSKLERNAAMKLSQMQDIGGCRAIMKNVKRVKRLVRLYKQRCEEKPDKGPEFVKAYDYIELPKSDGYRGVHLIHKYRSRSEKHKVFNGLRIEFQLRSALQHAWATAVETVGTFTQQALKSNQGDQDWLRFFALMGSAIAMREGTPIP
ncbi:MAG: hypothetical protein DMF60_08625 [Acidobacteria bacterium]|nr:MAG: hypothetical protein DMF60_08625 [Acidobacteriota bacterium]